MLRRFLFVLFFGLLITDVARAQNNAVGVIQYNVKNHQGGWIDDTPTGIIELQAQLIAYQVKARAKQSPPVDFIALEQSKLAGAKPAGDRLTCGACDAGKVRQGCDMTAGEGIDHLDRAARGVCDEDAAALWIEDAVIERAAGSVGYFDHARALQRSGTAGSSCGRGIVADSVHVQSPRKRAERCTGLGR